MGITPHFRTLKPQTLDFLEQLAANNNRDWFAANKARYEELVLEPALEFIRSFQPRLKKISPHFVASDRRVGGSLMRVYRDTRFARGVPFKTNIGIQLRHELGRDVHAPGFYIHIAPGECFLALGLWRPEPDALRMIREAIVESPEKWKRARDDHKFRSRWKLSGGSLKRPPRGFAADHPLIEDIKRTDFIAVEELEERDVLSKKFIDRVAESFAAGRPFMRFLCKAMRVGF